MIKKSKKIEENKTVRANTNALLTAVENKKNVSLLSARYELDQINMSELSFSISETILQSVADKLTDDSKALSEHMDINSFQLLENKKVRELVEEVLQLKLVN